MTVPTFWSYWNEDVKNEIEKAVALAPPTLLKLQLDRGKCPSIKVLAFAIFPELLSFSLQKNPLGGWGKKIEQRKEKKNKECLYCLSTLGVPISGLLQARIKVLIPKPSLCATDRACLRVSSSMAFGQD